MNVHTLRWYPWWIYAKEWIRSWLQVEILRLIIIIIIIINYDNHVSTLRTLKISSVYFVEARLIWFSSNFSFVSGSIRFPSHTLNAHPQRLNKIDAWWSSAIDLKLQVSAAACSSSSTVSSSSRRVPPAIQRYRVSAVRDSGIPWEWWGLGEWEEPPSSLLLSTTWRDHRGDASVSADTVPRSGVRGIDSASASSRSAQTSSIRRTWNQPSSTSKIFDTHTHTHTHHTHTCFSRMRKQ